MKFSTNLLVAATITLPLLAGCDSSSMTDPDLTGITLNLNAHVNGKPLATDSGTTYDLNGTMITFESARMYLSGFSLVTAENKNVEVASVPGEPLTVAAKNDQDVTISHTVHENIILAKQDTGMNKFDLGKWPTGDYQAIRFKVGIAGTTNRIDPSQVPSIHPLAKQTDLNNHWNWNAGYLFLRIDGQVDTDNNAIPDDKWAVHLGTEQFLREVTLTQNFTLQKDSPFTLDISVNYADFLKDVDLRDPEQRICHTMNNLPVARAVSEQIPSSFQFND